MPEFEKTKDGYTVKFTTDEIASSKAGYPPHLDAHSDAHHSWCDAPKGFGPCNCNFVPDLTKLTRYYSRYVCQDLDSDQNLVPGTEKVCHFGDSNTILGIRIGGRLCLSESEAAHQLARWNYPDGEEMGHHYSIYDPDQQEAGVEAGVTPKLPGMSDRDVVRESSRTRAEVGHVVGQGGPCWCGEHHLNARPGDPVWIDSGNKLISYKR